MSVEGYLMNDDQGVTHIQVYNILYFISYSRLGHSNGAPCLVRIVRSWLPYLPAYVHISLPSFLFFFVLERNGGSHRGRSARSARSERFGTIPPRLDSIWSLFVRQDSRKIYISYVLRALGIRRITIYPAPGSSPSDLSYHRRFLSFFFWRESTPILGSNRVPGLEHCRTIRRRNSMHSLAIPPCVVATLRQTVTYRLTLNYHRRFFLFF